MESRKFTGTVGGRVTGATAEVLVKVENQKFTGTVGGRVTGWYSEGSSEGGRPQVH